MTSARKSLNDRQLTKARQLEPEPESEEVGESSGSGPIRRRIKSLTIKLEPFATSLTNEEATNVRNTIESLLKSYFYTEQPWVIKDESTEIPEPENSDRNSSKNSIHDSTGYRDSGSSYIAPEGSITYVGLAQILENKQTEDQNGAELTMNGLVYFAEGSKNIPDETELLQAMETQALGDSEAVVEALQDYFPSQQQLVVTVETPYTESSAVPPPSSIAEEGNTNIGDGGDSEVPEKVEAKEPSDEELLGPIEVPPPLWSNEQQQQQQQQHPDQLVQGNSQSTSQSPLNVGALGGGVAVAVVTTTVLIGLFVAKKRWRNLKEVNTKEHLVGVINSSNHDDSDTEHGMFGLSSSNDDWKADNNRPSPLDVNADSEPAEASPTSVAISYLSSVFRRKSPTVEQHLEMANSADTDERRTKARSLLFKGIHNNKNNDDVNMSNYHFTDDGLSDFEDVVSIQPHMVPSRSLESFQKHHTTMKGRHEFVVQKDQLGWSFDEAPTNLLGEIDVEESPTLLDSGSAQFSSASLSTLANKPLMSNIHTGATAASGGDLSYSSSSTSSQLQEHLHPLQKNSLGAITDKQELEHEREDERVRYPMMPNPYVHNRSAVYGRQKAAGAVVEDRSASCVLQSTEFTAASLARGRKNISTNLSDTGSNNSMGMIPKLSAPVWWTLQDSGKYNNSKKNNNRSSPAVIEAYREDDLAYSGDEENTFGVADLDGWDPADAELSSMGDAPTQEEIKLLDFHPGAMPVNPTSSTINSTQVKESKNEDPPGALPIGNKYREPQGKSPMRQITPQSSKSIDASNSDEINKSILQKIKSSPEVHHYDNNNIGGDRIDDHRLGESIADLLDRDMSAEEIRFDLASMEMEI